MKTVQPKPIDPAPRVTLASEPDPRQTLEFLKRWIADARKRRAKREGREAA